MSRLPTAAAILLLLSWYLVAVLTIIGLVTGAAFLFYNSTTAQSDNQALIATAASFVLVAGVTAVNLARSVLASEFDPAECVLLARDDAPQLWALVDVLAARVGIPAPTKLGLLPEANALVHERTVLLGLLPGRKSLYVGVPLLLGLTMEELAAVLCHELGHHAAGHARYLALTHRGSAALHRVVHRTDKMKNGAARYYVWFAALPLKGFAALYNRVTLSTRRTHESAADRRAADLTSPETVVRALRRSYALDRSWSDFQRSMLDSSCLLGLYPDDPFAAYAHLLEDPAYAAALDTVAAGRLPSLTSRLDSHPSLADRAAALTTLDLDPEQSNPPTSLGSDAGNDEERIRALLPILGQRMAAAHPPGGNRRLRILPWSGWLAEAGGIAAAAPLVTLRGVMGADPAVKTKGSLDLLDLTLGVLEAGSADTMLQRIVQTDPARVRGVQDARRTAAEALLALIGQSLVAEGRASWRLEWGGVTDLVVPGFEGSIPVLVDEALATRQGAAALRAALGFLGLDLPGRPAGARAGTDRVAKVSRAMKLSVRSKPPYRRFARPGYLLGIVLAVLFALLTKH